jgi:hypothetical protein
MKKLLRGNTKKQISHAMHRPLQESFFGALTEQFFHPASNVRIFYHRAASSSGSERLGEKEGKKRSVTEGAKRTSTICAAESVRTVLQNWFAVHNRRYRIKICGIAERVNQDEAVKPVAFSPQVCQVQPKSDRISVEKNRLHAGSRNRLPHNRVREDGHAHTGTYGQRQGPQQSEFGLSPLICRESIDTLTVKNRKPSAPDIGERFGESSESSRKLFKSVRNLVRRDHEQ